MSLRTVAPVEPEFLSEGRRAGAKKDLAAFVGAFRQASKPAAEALTG